MRTIIALLFVLGSVACSSESSVRPEFTVIRLDDLGADLRVPVEGFDGPRWRAIRIERSLNDGSDRIVRLDDHFGSTYEVRLYRHGVTDIGRYVDEARDERIGGLEVWHGAGCCPSRRFGPSDLGGVSAGFAYQEPRARPPFEGTPPFWFVERYGRVGHGLMAHVRVQTFDLDPQVEIDRSEAVFRMLDDIRR